jgi:tetratricopeptide (TPR) repeat protein
MLVVCLVFMLTERLMGDRVCAFVAGALFALHPIHTEPVAWIAAVTDLEVTFFYLLTFGIFLAVARPGGRRSEPLLAGMVVSFILTLLSKEQAMTLPALATVYEHFYRADRSETSTSQKLARYGVLWLVGVAYLLFRLHFFGALAPASVLHEVTPQQIVLSAIALVGQYVFKLLWPVQLCAFYVFYASKSLFDFRVLAGLLVLLALAALLLACWRSRDPNIRFASFAILWFFATLAPVLNAHWVGVNVFSERYLYLPSVGVAWLTGLGASKLWSRAGPRPVRRRALALAGLLVAGLFAARIVIRNRDWNNDIVLYTRTLAVSPEAFGILDNLGNVYWDKGAREKAESLWRRAHALNPYDVIAINNLGLVASGKKQYPQAVEFFQLAAKLNPGETDIHLSLGAVYRLMGQAGPAEAEFRRAIALSPLNTGARNRLGELLLNEEGRTDEAEEQFRASVRIEPNTLAYDFLGAIAIRRRAMVEAERDFRAALNLDESDSNAHCGLGYVYKATGRKAEALSQYQAGLAKDPTNPEALAAIQELRQQSAATTP